MIHTEKEEQTEYLRHSFLSHCRLLSVVSLLQQQVVSDILLLPKKVHRFSELFFVYCMTMAEMHGPVGYGVQMTQTI